MICPSCSTQCDDSSTICENCGRRISGGRTPWLMLGCPLAILILVAVAAVIALLLKRIG